MEVSVSGAHGHGSFHGGNEFPGKTDSPMPLKIDRNPKGKDRLPAINFHGQAVSFREDKSQEC